MLVRFGFQMFESFSLRQIRAASMAKWKRKKGTKSKSEMKVNIRAEYVPIFSLI